MVGASCNLNAHICVFLYICVLKYCNFFVVVYMIHNVVLLSSNNLTHLTLENKSEFLKSVYDVLYNN